jgi:hypothetical protein
MNVKDKFGDGNNTFAEEEESCKITVYRWQRTITISVVKWVTEP